MRHNPLIHANTPDGRTVTLSTFQEGTGLLTVDGKSGHQECYWLPDQIWIEKIQQLHADGGAEKITNYIDKLPTYQ